MFNLKGQTNLMGNKRTPFKSTNEMSNEEINKQGPPQNQRRGEQR